MNGPTAAARPAWTEMIDLASARLGGRAVACSDDFFAGMENLVRPEPAVFIPGKYTPRGKWMDGWESRRKRVPGSDWCIVELGRPGSVRGYSSEVDQLPNVTCLTPDSRMVMVVMNDSDGARRFRVQHQGAHATLELGAGDVATLRWIVAVNRYESRIAADTGSNA